MPANDSERQRKALTADSIDQLRQALDGVERVADAPVDIDDASVTVLLDPDDAAALDALAASLGGAVNVEDPAESPAPHPVEPAGFERDDATREPSGEHAPIGEVQRPDESPQLPQVGSIAYAVLCLMVARGATVGNDDGWATTRDVSSDPWMPYDFRQVQGALSRLHDRLYCTERQRLEPGDEATLRYGNRAIEAAVEHVREHGRFPWPDDAGKPDDPAPPADRPYLLPGEQVDDDE